MFPRSLSGGRSTAIIATGKRTLVQLGDALAGSRAEFCLLAEAMSQLVWSARVDGTIEYCNGSWINATHLRAKDLQASSFTAAVHPDERSEVDDGWVAAIRSGQTYEMECRLRTPTNGGYQWFFVRAIPIHDADGSIVSWVGMATDIDEQKRSAEKVEAVLEAASALSSLLDEEEIYKQFAQLTVKCFADFSVVLRLEEDEELRSIAVAHHDPLKEQIAHVLVGQRVLRPAEEAQFVARILAHKPWVSEVDDYGWRGVWGYLAHDLKGLQIGSVLIIPLHSRAQTYGVLIACYTADSHRTRRDWDLPLFIDLSQRTSMAIEKALLSKQEQHLVETLQKSLLPTSLPRLPGLHFSAEYVPNSQKAEMGGDWYDAFLLKDGTLLISIGDVMGRGLKAASMMGLVRQAIAATALQERDPTQVLDLVDNIFSQYHQNEMVTVFLAFIDPQRRFLRYANAGHLYPVLLRQGELIELNESRGLPIGLRTEFSAQDKTQEFSLDGVELLMMYTDGLVESTCDLLAGEQRLRQALSCDAILRVHDQARFLRDVCVVKDCKDDIAILAVRFQHGEYWSFDADNARAAQDTRGEFVRYLQRFAVGDELISLAELIFGELIGNVVRHAPGPIDVQVDWSDRHPVLHVLDRGTRRIGEPKLPNDPMSEGGRGLFIIQSISKKISVERIEGYGNHVSVVLPIEKCSN